MITRREGVDSPCAVKSAKTMKRTDVQRLAVSVALVGVLVVALTGMALAQENLLVNPSFEDGLEGWGLIYQNRQTMVTALDETVGHTGKASFRTESGNPADLTGARQDIHDPQPGTYRISVAYKTEGFVHGGRALSSALARIQFKGADGTNLGPNLHLMLIQDTGGEWTVLETEFYVPEETKSLVVELLSYYIMGKVWWDDVTIERIGD